MPTTMFQNTRDSDKLYLSIYQIIWIDLNPKMNDLWFFINQNVC